VHKATKTCGISS